MNRLFTSFYPEPNAQRHAEILECLKRNLALSAIDEVCLLLENTEAPLEHSKLTVKRIAKRPRYSELFQWARELQTAVNDVAILCNSDIYFENSLHALTGQLRADICVALTRWDVHPDGTSQLFHRNDTQDSWIFKGAIKEIVDDFHIGVPRCDNRMLHELKQAGYRVINPAFSVKSLHLHVGQREEYAQDNLTNFVDPPYAYLWPHNLRSLPATMLHNVLQPGSGMGWRIDWRRIRQSLPCRFLAKLGRTISPKIQATDAA